MVYCQIHGLVPGPTCYCCSLNYANDGVFAYRHYSCEVCGDPVPADATLRLCDPCRTLAGWLVPFGVVPQACGADVQTALPGSEKARRMGVTG